MNVTKKINKLTITTKTIIKKLNFSSEIFNSFDDSAIISNNLLSFPIRVKNKKTFDTRYGIKNASINQLLFFVFNQLTCLI